MCPFLSFNSPLSFQNDDQIDKLHFVSVSWNVSFILLSVSLNYKLICQILILTLPKSVHSIFSDK